MKRRSLPFCTAVIIISAFVALVTAMLTAPPLTVFVICAAEIAALSAVVRILSLLEAAVRRVHAYEQKGQS